MRPEQIIRLGATMSATANVVGFKCMEDGTIVSLMITVGDVSPTDAIFNLNINDTPQFSGAGRPKIAIGDKSVILDGLSIDVSQFDIISVDLVAGDALTPIEVGVKFYEAPPDTVVFPYDFSLAASDEVTAIAIANALVIAFVRRAFTLTRVTATLSVASTSGLPAIRIKKNGTSIFSTNITIDSGEKDSKTAATAYVLVTTPTTFADGDEIQIDVTAAGTGAKGLKIYFEGTLI